MITVLLAVWMLVFPVQTIRVAWDPPADPRVNAYRVYFGTTPGRYTIRCEAGAFTEFLYVAPEAAPTRYYVTATALVLGEVESQRASEVNGVTSTMDWNPVEDGHLPLASCTEFSDTVSPTQLPALGRVVVRP